MKKNLISKFHKQVEPAVFAAVKLYQKINKKVIKNHFLQIFLNGQPSQSSQSGSN